MKEKKTQQRVPVVVRGGGDIATGSIYALYKAGFAVIILETDRPSAIRREVAFSDAVYRGEKQVEDVTCFLCEDLEEAIRRSQGGELVMLIDPQAKSLEQIRPIVLVDAILAKKNLGTTRDMADTVIALGPGFYAGRDADYVVETMRGHTLGRVIEEGEAIPNTGIPGEIAGHAADRVIHAPAKGIFYGEHKIGDWVKEGEIIGRIIADCDDSGNGKSEDESAKSVPVTASLTGVLRGIIMDMYPVTEGFKIADIDPRQSETSNCFTISDKARCIAAAVLMLTCRAYSLCP